MFGRRFINTLVSVPLVLLISAALIVGTAYVGHQLDTLEQVFKPVGPGGMLVMMVAFVVESIVFIVLALGTIASLLYAGYALFTGDGLLYRRVDEGDVIQNPDGSVFKEFDKTDFINRSDPMLSGRRLVFQSDF